MALPFFSSSATSFIPTSRATFQATRTQMRPNDSLSIPQSMDPLPTDPNVLFVHPPFTSFPNSDQNPEGLTYTLIAEHPEWFLDPNDFISQNNTNPNAVPYPSCLEPPRGWCPAKKKDLKERGPDGWPEGEEPRLRCTFCRRTYAGVNAKSMWRRHVYEKHKIAMSNRRDNNERPRGRGSGKENRQLASGSSQDGLDNIISIVVAPQTSIDTVAHKSRFRASKSDSTRPRKFSEANRLEEAPQASGSCSFPTPVDPPPTKEEPEEQQAKVVTPPSTPQVASSDLPLTSDAVESASPTLPRTVLPESPYNPLQTPAFRHSPPPLPSDHPWKYCSPSHPLSLTRNLSLTALVRDCTPLSKATPSSRFSSPCKPSTSRLDLVDTPLLGKSQRKSGSRSFLMGPPSSISPIKRHDWLDSRLHGSPLSRSNRRSPRHQRHSSDLSDGWIDAPPSTYIPLGADPFDESWGTINPVLSPPRGRSRDQEVEPESPILRSGLLPRVGSGETGLMSGFSLVNEGGTKRMEGVGWETPAAKKRRMFDM